MGAVVNLDLVGGNAHRLDEALHGIHVVLRLDAADGVCLVTAGDQGIIVVGDVPHFVHAAAPARIALASCARLLAMARQSDGVPERNW